MSSKVCARAAVPAALRQALAVAQRELRAMVVGSVEWLGQMKVVWKRRRRIKRTSRQGQASLLEKLPWKASCAALEKKAKPPPSSLKCPRTREISQPHRWGAAFTSYYASVYEAPSAWKMVWSTWLWALIVRVQVTCEVLRSHGDLIPGKAYDEPLRQLVPSIPWQLFCEVIGGLKLGEAVGTDGLTSEMLRALGHDLLGELYALLHEHLWVRADCPSLWRRGCTVLLPKGTSQTILLLRH